MKRQNLSLNVLDLRLKQASYNLHVFEILLTQEINAFVVTAPVWEPKITGLQSVSASPHTLLQLSY